MKLIWISELQIYYDTNGYKNKLENVINKIIF